MLQQLNITGPEGLKLWERQISTDTLDPTFPNEATQSSPLLTAEHELTLLHEGHGCRVFSLQLG